MAVTFAAPPQQPPEEDHPLVRPPSRWRITLDGELLLYVLLLVVAGAMRFWDLGTRAQHHDESLHALYSWYLYTGRGYVHDPMMHGPFLFHANALIYFLFGDTDATSRVLPALFGTVLVGLPFFLRDYLGRMGALATAALLAFSPVLLYYSRFIRNELYVAVWNMVLVICLWRYLQEARHRYLYLAAAMVALNFCTKEVAYITIAIFGAYLLITTLPELLPRLRRGLDLSDLPPRAEYMMVVGTLALPQAAAGALMVWTALGFPAPTGVERTLLITASVSTLALAAVALGLRWNPKVWLISALIFTSLYVVLYTTFFTNLPGFVSGIWGSLEYWLAQQEVKRGGQPWFYYLALLPLYEFLPLAVVLAAAAVKLRGNLPTAGLALLAAVGLAAAYAEHDGRGLSAWATDGAMPHLVAQIIPALVALAAGVALLIRHQEGLLSFTGFLVFWLVGATVAYSYAGEKMPWLVVHIAQPLILLAGLSLGWFLERVPWRAAWREGSVLVIPVLLLTPLVAGVLLGRSTAALFSAPRPGEVAALALLVVLLLYVGQGLVRSTPGPRLAALAALAGVLLLAAFTIRTGVQAAYYHGDIPVEMLVYTQTSPEVPGVLRDIEEVARASGQGKELPITVDATDGFTWPWAWYLRHYKKVDYPSLNAPSGPPLGSVLLLNAANETANRTNLTKYSGGRRYPHRWWFPEDTYRSATVVSLAASVASLDTLGAWWRYVMYRELPQNLGSTDALLYLPRDISTVALTAPPTSTTRDEYASLATDLHIAATIDGRGREAGAFEGPRGVAVDAAGNIYISEAVNHRVVKFDASGQFVAQVGRNGSGDGEFHEPWGLAVDRQGNVYVADTWNHRVQKFDAQLRFMGKWGEFANVAGPYTANPGRFFGPRAIVLDSEGNLLVTDTGNKRVQKFDPDGKFLGVYGGFGRGPGQFSEPVGLAVAPNGDILVADTWNRRIQRFDRSFTFVAEFPVRAWPGEGLLNKPFLTMEPGGAILTTDPENHRILRFSAQGVPLAALGRASDSTSLRLPIGVTVSADGQVYVADAGNRRVLRLGALP